MAMVFGSPSFPLFQLLCSAELQPKELAKRCVRKTHRFDRVDLFCYQAGFGFRSKKQELEDAQDSSTHSATSSKPLGGLRGSFKLKADGSFRLVEEKSVHGTEEEQDTSFRSKWKSVRAFVSSKRGLDSDGFDELEAQRKMLAAVAREKAERHKAKMLQVRLYPLALMIAAILLPTTETDH